MTKTIYVTQAVTVTVPDEFFTPEFMREYQEQFFDFATPEDHLKHLAQLYARGLVHADSFIEGYGSAAALGILVVSEVTEVDVVA